MTDHLQSKRKWGEHPNDGKGLERISVRLKAEHLPSKERIDFLAEYWAAKAKSHERRPEGQGLQAELIGLIYADTIAALKRINSLTRNLDTCGMECSATFKSLAAENEELRRDLTRTESAHAVVMAENAHYKQVAADRESALRNCLLLAMRQARRDSDWEHIIRFCREGGVEPSPLRTEP